MLGRLLVVALTFFPLAARACDLCGCYSPQVESMPKEKVSLTGFYTAIAEQFTHFGTLQFDDHEVANPTGQRLDSSITQFVVGYEINNRLALQFNAPFIYRDFRRPEGFAIDEGNVSGLGDVSLLAKAVLWHFASTAWREFNIERKKSGCNRARIRLHVLNRRAGGAKISYGQFQPAGGRISRSGNSGRAGERNPRARSHPWHRFL